jgi:hypothetical protein
MADDNTGSWMDFAQRSRDDGGLGLERHQAAGVVGNLQNESGSGVPSWGPTGDNGTAWGSAQWRNDRLDNLKAHAQANGLDYRTPEAQQAFMRHEFDTSENGAYQALQAAQTPEQAAAAVDARYERSDGSTRPQRMAAARRLFDGSSGPTAIDAAMGRTRSTGSRMAFAPTDDEETPTAPPALSAAATLGPGQLGANPAGAPAPKNWLDILGTTLMNMAPGIAQDPENKKALVQAAQAAQKNPADQGSWSMKVLPDGRMVSINSKTNEVRTMGTAAKPADPKWSASDNGSGGPGFIPANQAELDKIQADAAAKAAAGPQLLGDGTKTGAEYRATLDPVNAAIIEGLHNGTGQLPSSFKANDPAVKQLQASAMHAYPDLDLTNLPARKDFATKLHNANTGAYGGQITASNTALTQFNKIADNYIALHNGGDVMGVSALGNVKNSFTNAAAGSERKGLLSSLDANSDTAAGEISKLLSGTTGGGVDERMARHKRLGDPNAVPAQAAGVLEAELDSVKAKHSELVDQSRFMGQSFLDKNPQIEQNFLKQEATLRDKIAQLRGAGTQDAPTKALPRGVKSIQVIN